MGLGTYIRELFTPGRHITDKNHWERQRDDILKDKDVQHALSENKDERLARLEEITGQNFEKYKNYFEDDHTGSNVVRYGSLGANVFGGITAAGGILAMAAGGPITAAGAVGAGLGYLMVGSIGNLVADIYDSSQVGKAVDQRYEKDESEAGVLNYVKKAATGVWDVVSSPFRKSTYKNIAPLAEGVGTNVVAAYGSEKIGQYLGESLGGIAPYAQIATFGASGVAFYRGRKKFEDQLLKHIRNESKKQFLEEIVSEHQQAADVVTDEKAVIETKPLRKGLMPIQSVYTPEYDVLNKGKNLDYVKPRRT